MARAPLSEAEAVRLFADRARAARGAVVVRKEDEEEVRVIVRALGANRVAIAFAAAYAETLSVSEIAARVEQLDAELAPEPEGVRARLARGEARRLEGRLSEAAEDLEEVLRQAKPGDLVAAEAHRLLGAIYRAQGRPEEALAHKERALALHEALGDPRRIAAARGEVGTALAALGRLREARAQHEHAVALHRRLKNRRQEGIELSYLGVALHRLGHLKEALRAHRAALALHEETGHRRLEGAELLHLGYVQHELGATEPAHASLVDALRVLREVGDRALEGVAMSHLGALEVEEGRAEEAGPLLHQALALHAEAGSTRHEATSQLHLAYHHEALGDEDAARAALEASLAKSAGVEPEQRAWVLALLDREDEARKVVHEDALTARAIDLLAAAFALARGAGDAARARALVVETRGSGRVASTKVRRALARLEAALAASTAEAELVVARDGGHFVTVAGERVELGRKRPLRLMIAALAERRMRAPGEGVPWQDLLGVGWPGQRVLAEAGFGRVRNAVFQLRKLGFGKLLVNQGDGYLLDPKVPMRWGA